jgi:hypothetical protein
MDPVDFSDDLALRQERAPCARAPDDLISARADGKELLDILHGLVAQRPACEDEGQALIAALAQTLQDEADPALLEVHLEQFSRKVRAFWLRAVAAETSWVLRSPTEQEAGWISARHDAFGYERDLQPVELEERCNAFYGQVPWSWSAEHVLFSSGQAALQSVLLALGSPQPLRVRHLGGYFETRELIRKTPSLCTLVEGQADVVIAEPVASNGNFCCHGVEEILAAAQGARILLLDTTLLGRDDGLEQVLLRTKRDVMVIRIASGLKLLQGGLELANVGLVGVHARSATQRMAFASALRERRTLSGAGLRFADVLALEAPFVFDAGFADGYAGAIFAHNAALARAVGETNRLFVPPFTASPAPYCIFALRSGDDSAYDKLAERIAQMASERKLLFPRGGSFGFRGHRYEIVCPEDRAPFLRVAMGRRGGQSCQGIIALMAEIAGSLTV